MQFADAARQLDPEIYRRLRQSIELGKWPDGRALTQDQKVVAMEAVIHYEQSNNVPETERVGYMETVCKSKSAPDAASPNDSADEPAPLRFVDDKADSVK